MLFFQSCGCTPGAWSVDTLVRGMATTDGQAMQTRGSVHSSTGHSSPLCLAPRKQTRLDVISLSFTLLCVARSPQLPRRDKKDQLLDAAISWLSMAMRITMAPLNSAPFFCVAVCVREHILQYWDLQAAAECGRVFFRSRFTMLVGLFDNSEIQMSKSSAFSSFFLSRSLVGKRGHRHF